MAAGAVERVHIHKHLGQTEAVFLMVASLKMSPRNMWAVKVQSPQFLSWVRLLLPCPHCLHHFLTHSRCLSVYEVYMGGHIETTAPHVPLCHSLPSLLWMTLRMEPPSPVTLLFPLTPYSQSWGYRHAHSLVWLLCACRGFDLRSL